MSNGGHFPGPCKYAEHELKTGTEADFEDGLAEKLSGARKDSTAHTQQTMFNFPAILRCILGFKELPNLKRTLLRHLSGAHSIMQHSE